MWSQNKINKLIEIMRKKIRHTTGQTIVALGQIRHTTPVK